MRKKDNSARPVVSAIITPEYELAKFLNKLLKPYIPNKFTWDFSQELLNKVKCFAPDYVMVSFVVVSLFTHIPLTETINTIADFVHAENNDSHPSHKKNIFVKLVHIATQELFLYKDTQCKQIDGVVNASPLGPTMANFFMANLQTKLLKETSKSHPKLYLRRYVDDISAILDDQQFCASFLNTLNL